jgi:tetratricopeptide (TPR) repeat protein
MLLPGRDEPNVDVCALVLDWLNNEKSGQWLLVIDNADDSSIFLPLTSSDLSSGNVTETRKPLLHYIPRRPSSRIFNQSVLITSRDSILGEDLAYGVPPICVLPFDATESRLLLAKRAGKEEDNLADSDAEKLLELLDHIPLAITQAAAFMRRNNMSLQEYLTALIRDERSLSEYLNAQHRDYRRELGVPSSVFRTWKLTFDQIQLQHPRAADILSLSAMFDRQQIPHQLLLQGQEDKNDLNFVQAISILTGFSLLAKEIGHKTFSMHRLVQLSILAWLEHKNEKARYEHQALFSLSGICPTSVISLQSRYDLEKLYPHLQAVLQYRFEKKTTIRVWAGLLMVMIGFDHLLGRWNIAHEKSLQAYEKTKRVLGDDDVTTLSSLFQVMQCLVLQRKYEEAEKICEELILGYKKTVGADDERTFFCILYRARILLFQMDFEAAEEIGTQLLVDCENIFGIEHRIVLAIASELSKALTSQGKIEAAEKLLRRIVDRLENKLGPGDAQTLVGVRALGELLRDRGDDQAAEEMFRWAAGGGTNHQGRDPDDRLLSMLHLANVLNKRGDYSEAEKLHRQPLQEEKELFDGKSLNNPTANYALALNLYYQGKYESSFQFCQRALARYREMNGPDDEQTVRSSRLYDLILKKMGEEAARGSVTSVT